MYGALDSNPDEAARAKNLSNKSGVPVDIVQRNYAQVNRNVQLNEFDETLKRSPLLGQFLSNRSNAQISHDDSANLAGIEREYGTIKPIEPHIPGRDHRTVPARLCAIQKRFCIKP